MAKKLGMALIVAVISWMVTASFVQAQAPAPAFKEGDIWQLKFESKGQRGTSTDRLDGIFEIAFTQGVFKLYEVEGGKGRGGEIPIQIGTDDRSERLLAGFGQIEKRQALKFPLSVGQKWNYEYTTRPVGATSDQKRSVEVNVVGMEDVATPAGTFKAFKLVRVEAYFPSARATKYVRATVTYFYSPDTKSNVKSSSTNDANDATIQYELIKFTPGS